MPSLNESLYTSPSAKRALALNKDRVALAESIRAKKGLGTSYERKILTAQCIENTKHQLRVLESVNAGATQTASIGQYKRYAIDMVSSLMPSLIAPDIVSTQSLDNRVGMINILKYQYSESGQFPAGHTFASPFGLDQDNTYAAGIQTITAVAGATQTGLRPGANIVSIFNNTRNEDVTPTDLTVPANGQVTLGGAGASVAANDILIVKYDIEQVPVKAPGIKLDIDSIPITAEPRKLQAIWSFDAQYELYKEYGSDLQKQLATQAVAEIQSEIDNEIILDLYAKAGGPDVIWSKSHQQYISTADHYDGFWAKVLEASEAIFTATKRARANFMVCGVGVDSVIRAMRNFSGVNDTTAVGPHYVGTLGDLKVYVNPYLGKNDAVIGYKGDTLLDSGYIYAPYMPILTTGMVTLSDDFASREGWASMYGKKMINPNLYCRIHIV